MKNIHREMGIEFIYQEVASENVEYLSNSLHGDFLSRRIQTGIISANQNHNEIHRCV